MRRFPAIFALLVAPALGAGESSGRIRFALRASRVYTGREVIENGIVLVEDGRIASVGRDGVVPDGVPLHELRGRAILPGLIDPETTLAEGGRDTRRSISPEVLALDGWDFYADRRALLAGGVTAVHVTPGSRRLISGRGLVVKTGGHDRDIGRRILRRSGGLRVNLGEVPKNPPALYEPPVPPSPDRPFETLDLQAPTSRAGEFMALRAVLRRAREYRDAIRAAGVRAGPLPAPDAEAAAILAVVRGEDRLRVRADRAHDIERVLALAREMEVPVILEGAREGYRIADIIARSGAPVIYRGPIEGDGTDSTRLPASGKDREGTAAALARAGVPLAIDSPGDQGVASLLLQAAASVREGLSPELALRAVTLTAAEILGVADRIGSIEAGKDADIVVLSVERPFEEEGGAALSPEAVYIGGDLVHSAAPPEIPPGSVVIRCGRILTANDEISGGVIVVKNGKILHVGSGAPLKPLPSGVESIDASRDVVVPGLIDAGTPLGVRLDALAPARFDDPEGARGQAGGGRAIYRLAEAVDPADPAVRANLRATIRSGITTAIVSPDPVGSIAGQLTAMKLSGRSRAEMMLKEHAGLLFGSIRSEEIQSAREYHERWLAHEKAVEAQAGSGGAKAGDPSPPAREEAHEPLRPLFRGLAPAVVRARSKEQIAGILRELGEKHKMAVAVFGPDSGIVDLDGAVLEELKRAGASLILGPELIVRRPPPDGPLNLPRLAAGSGARFAFRSGSAAASRRLPVEAAAAVRPGREAREALRAFTIEAARIFRIDDRVGSIEKGKDADLVFLSGEPFALASRVRRVMVGGAIVFEEGQE